MTVAGKSSGICLRGLRIQLASRLSSRAQTHIPVASSLPDLSKRWFRSGREGVRPQVTMPDILRYQLNDEVQLVIQQGDITHWKGEAIVNAANEVMLGGGGVDGAIHRAAGPRLLQACKLYPPKQGGRCPTGDAHATLAYDLPCKWVIHTVGPVFSRQHAKECEQLLARAYRSSLAVANGLGAARVAFPAISCGVYGYPLESACYTAIRTCYEHSHDLKEIHFVLFGSDTYDMWKTQAAKYWKTSPETSQDAEQHQSAAGASEHSAESQKSPADSSSQEDAAMDTLTGPKHGQSSEAAQTALDAKPVLENSKPVTDADLLQPADAVLPEPEKVPADTNS